MREGLATFMILLFLSHVCTCATAPIALRATEKQEPAKQASPPDCACLKAPLVGFGLEDGTPVKLRLTRALSSADGRAGDRADFEVVQEVKVGDAVVIPRGSIAWATVKEAQHKRRMARGGKLTVVIEEVRLASGERAPLRAVKKAQGGGHVGVMTGAIAATGIVFFPAAPFFLFMHGKDTTIPKGTEITAYINGNIPLDQAKFASSAAEIVSAPESPSTPVATQPGPGAETAVSAIILVKSTPDGADILVEGKHMGSTPSTLKLSAGEYKIRLEKTGFKPWEQTVTLNSGASPTIDATLEKTP